MKKIKLLIILGFLWIPTKAFVIDEDSARMSVKLKARYLFETKTVEKNARTVSDGEVGSIPACLNLFLEAQPFLRFKSPVQNIFFLQDTRIQQDRTSSEFGVGFRKKESEIYASFGFRIIRKDDGPIRGLSTNFEKSETRSVGTNFKFKIIGIENTFSVKISYDGKKEWFYVTELSAFPFKNISPFHFTIFHESYYGTGTYVAYRNRKGSTDIFSGYLFPESKISRLYHRSEGITLGLTHTWR